VQRRHEVTDFLVVVGFINGSSHPKERRAVLRERNRLESCVLSLNR
jgi:hypothetical protein